MKNINGKVLAIVAITTIAGISSANAMMGVTPTTTTGVSITNTSVENEGQKVYMGGSANFDESKNGRMMMPPKRPDFTGGEYADIKAKLYEEMKAGEITEEEFKEKIVKIQEEMKAKYKDVYEANKDKIKDNRDRLEKDASKIKDAFADLSEEVKEKLKVLRDEHRASMDELIKELKNKDLSIDDREVIRAKLKELNVKNAENIKDLVSSDENAKAFIESREEIYKNNSDLRKSNVKAQKEVRGKRDELVKKYKEKFVSKLSDKITKLSSEKLTTVNDKIKAMIEKYENNSKITEDKKDKIIAQLISLEEIITEELENREEASDEIDLDAIFED